MPNPVYGDHHEDVRTTPCKVSSQHTSPSFNNRIQRSQLKDSQLSTHSQSNSQLSSQSAPANQASITASAPDSPKASSANSATSPIASSTQPSSQHQPNNLAIGHPANPQRSQGKCLGPFST